MWRAIEDELEAVFRDALREVAPDALVRQSLRFDGETLWVAGEPYPLPADARLVVVAFGKAAARMAGGAVEALDGRIDRGIVVTKEGVAAGALPSAFTVLRGSHPVPSEQSLAAGHAVLAAVSGLAAHDLVLVLVSGGGSALIEVLRPGITLAHLAETTDTLLRAGADIWLLNAVRRRLSLIKGGGLARAAAPARVINLVISDVLGNPLPVIASGPTVAPEREPRDLPARLHSLGIWDALPSEVRAALTAPPAEEPLDNVLRSVVLADARRLATAVVDAMRRRSPIPAVLVADRFTGEAREFARFWCALARQVREHGEPWPAPVLLVGAGELTVTVRGGGVGGRNTEMALAAALELDGLSQVWVASLASDGDDGVSGLAGGIVDGETAAAIRERGLDPLQLLRENDSARALRAVGAAVTTGPTGTNVNDVYLALVL